MPYKVHKLHISLGKYDRRKSGLSDEDKDNIKNLHSQGMGVREIARKYEKLCSRRLIQFIIFPERLNQLQDRNRENKHWKKYANRKKLTEAKRNWDHYKHNLYKSGQIN